MAGLQLDSAPSTPELDRVDRFPRVNTADTSPRCRRPCSPEARRSTEERTLPWHVEITMPCIDAPRATTGPCRRERTDMAGLMERIKKWFSREEQRSLRADLVHKEFDDMTDRVADHKDHMIDRIQRPDE